MYIGVVSDRDIDALRRARTANIEEAGLHTYIDCYERGALHPHRIVATRYGPGGRSERIRLDRVDRNEQWQYVIHSLQPGDGIGIEWDYQSVNAPNVLALLGWTDFI